MISFTNIPRGLARVVKDLLKFHSSIRAKYAYLRQKAIAEINPWRLIKGLKEAFPDFTEQTRLINSLRTWDFLVVLDACRYDVFEELIYEFLDGKLLRVRSPASMTIPWLNRTWYRTYENVIYVSAHPYINSVKPINSFDARGKFLAVIDVWRDGFDFSYGTTPPWNVNKAIRKLMLSLKVRRALGRFRGEPKLVIHYVQPHFPYIGSKEIRKITRVMRVVKEKLDIKSLELGHLVNAVLMDRLNGDVNALEDFLRRSYKKTLKMVLEHVASLSEFIRGQLVITSDHGELLGEYGLFFHLPLPLPELRYVPWFIVR